MTEIRSYLQALFFMSQTEIPVESGYHRRHEMIPTIWNIVEGLLKNYQVMGIDDSAEVAASIFDILVNAKVLKKDEPKFAGPYYQYIPSKYSEFRKAFMENDGIAVTAKRIGAKFFPDAFEGYLRETLFDREELSIPAADRVVSLNHNDPDHVQVREGIEQLLETVRGVNDADFSENERSRLITRLGVAQTLWDAAELRTIEIKVGIVMAIEDASNALEKIGRAVSISLLVDLIKAIVKRCSQVDLDSI